MVDFKKASKIIRFKSGSTELRYNNDLESDLENF